MRSHARRHWNSTSYRSAWGLSLVAIVAACGSSTAPNKAGDPSMLITNNLDSSMVNIVWHDGAAIVGEDSVPARTGAQCVRFTAQPDSAYWQITAHDHGAVSTQRIVGYFNPADRPAWRVIVSADPVGSPQIIVKDTTVAC